MRKYLALAALLLVGCTEREPIIRADDVELIHVDIQAVTINVTVSADGKRATIALTPQAALKLQSSLSQTFTATLESAEALRAQQATTDP